MAGDTVTASQGQAAALVAQLAAARQRQVQLPSGPAVTIGVPSQFAAHALVAAMRANQGDELIALLARGALGWSGVTGEMLLGQGVGSADPAPFAPQLLQAWLADRPEDAIHLAEQAVHLATQARKQAEGDAKN